MRFSDADGSVVDIHMEPKLVGPTASDIWNIYAVSEKVRAFAYRTTGSQAPSV